MKIRELTQRLVLISLFGTATVSNLFSQSYFEEKSSLIVAEIESVPIRGVWQKSETTVQSKTIQFIYSNTEYFNNPGNSLLEYKIKINNPGTYRFQWHCKVGKGTSATDYNDTWLRIPDASAFYAERTGHIVRPKGVCSTDCPNGSGSGGWFKVYSNGTTSWTWRTSTSDNDPHSIFARFDKAGIYTIQISARSSYHFIDRFVLYNPKNYSESQATNLNLPESAISTVTAINEEIQKQVEVFPNPAGKYIVLANLNNREYRYEILDLTGRVQLDGRAANNNEKIEIDFLKTGIYVLKLIDKNGNQKSVKFGKLDF